MRHIEEMTTEKRARDQILAAVRPVSPRRVNLTDAVGQFAAHDSLAGYSLPRFDNSAMDGYAVVAGDKNRLRVVGEQPAGRDRRLRIGPGEAVRIFTGAPIPHGATAVVMQEDVTRHGDEIVINAAVDPGDFIRARGCDLAEGQKIIQAGERITAAKAALLASQGMSEAVIGGVVAAAVLTTGDELVAPGESLGPGQIYDSNSVLLHALLQRAGTVVEVVEHCSDDFDQLSEAISRGLKQRVLVISGGVSVGEHDLARRALESAGAEVDLWKIAIKPGKPFLFARTRQCCVFGLPGNPVSSFVTFMRFVRPAVLKMRGAADVESLKMEAALSGEISNEDERRPHYVRGRLSAGTFTPIGRQESHALFGLSQSNALLCVLPGSTLHKGDRVLIEIVD